MGASVVGGGAVVSLAVGAAVLSVGAGVSRKLHPLANMQSARIQASSGRIADTEKWLVFFVRIATLVC